MTPAFASVGDFLAMGGYGLYVWGSFLMGAGTFVWEAVQLAQQRRRAIEVLRDDARAAEPTP